MKQNNTDLHLERTKHWGPSNNTFIAVHKINNYKRRALDLGCGSLRNSKFLYNCGFRIDAIDKNPIVKNYTKFFEDRIIIDPNCKEFFSLKIEDFIDTNFGSSKYDIIVAENSLSFNKKNDVEKVVKKVYTALKKNGIFAGNLYGLYDFRSSNNESMSFYTKSESKSLLKKFNLISIDECEEDDREGSTKFHWHTFEFIAQKIK